MHRIPESELIINTDGTIFHLHLRPEQIADRIILVGDPGRVDTISERFDTIECEVANREFRTLTGFYRGKRITALSTGIGCDNIDIVVTELDALANIDFHTRMERQDHRSLTLVRVGTCGGLQPFTPAGAHVASVKAVGFDGLLNYYARRNEVCDTCLERAFVQHMQWAPAKGAPYVTTACQSLIERVAADDMVRGITATCGGFYGPQGRAVRLVPQDPRQNEKIVAFEHEGLRVCNYEMETSALLGLAAMLGHEAMTCCLVVADRRAGLATTDYHQAMGGLIDKVLERI